MKLSTYLKIMGFAAFLYSCDSGPKVVESVSQASSDAQSSAPSAEMPDVSPAESEMHQIEVKEVLETERYTYMNVSEDGEEFWVAVTKRPVAVGDTYYFKGGLLKKNFFSQEYNRVFETLYLVSDLRQQPVGAGGSAVDQALNRVQGGNAVANDGPVNVTPAEGAISLKELFNNKQQYEGQSVKVTGKIVKINPMIMGRNWIHLQDGTGEDLDLTVTTMENIPLGHVVTLEGTIALNKDFGAGYRYDIIMEGAASVQ